MKLWDVNLWVYAFRTDSPFYGKASTAISESLERCEEFLFCPSVASSFLRLVTNSRIFKQPSSVSEAWTFLDWMEGHPLAVFADADPITYGIFKHICLVSLNCKSYSRFKGSHQ